VQTSAISIGVGFIGIGFIGSDGRLHFAKLGIAVHDVIQRRTTATRAFLGYMRNNIIGVQSKLTVVRLELAQQHCEQRRFATTIGTNQSHSLPGVSLETGVFDEQLPPSADTDVIQA
jgi:hypothetical protein